MFSCLISTEIEVMNHVLVNWVKSLASLVFVLFCGVVFAKITLINTFLVIFFVIRTKAQFAVISLSSCNASHCEQCIVRTGAQQLCCSLLSILFMWTALQSTSPHRDALISLCCHSCKYI